MQTPSRRNIEKIRSKDKVKTDGSVTSRKSEDEKPKKLITTPRNYLQNTSTSDIYGKKKGDVSQAPKKAFSTTLNTAKNISPMKDYLKSNSTVSVRKTSTKMAAEKKVETKVNLHSARTPRIVKAQAPANVTVNSPILKRSVELKKEKSNLSIGRSKNINNKHIKVDEKSNMADIFLRQRSKTRTLDENEVKVLKADVDNNAEMQNLAKRLNAKPKAFFVDLNGEEAKVDKEKCSEDEVSYEDDFESYESDFDSYHSESQSDGNSSNNQNSETEETDINLTTKDEINIKENEEKMLDSGNFDLRDPQRSAQKITPLDFIHEVTEDFDKRISLTDEGFQDMSTSSGFSMKTVHVDVLESMVTLHEMTYTLFEMQPIPYDLYMATFGGRNTMQVAVQTFDDGVSQDVQTEDIIYENLQKCLLCLWDFSGVLKEPIKVLIAPDNVTIGQFRGGTDGIIVAALEDGSVHLWDLSEKATWINTSDEKTTNSVEIVTDRMTQTEIDREWNLKNSTINNKKITSRPMQISAYTSSGVNIIEKGINDFIVALEFIGESSLTSQDEGRKIIAQMDVCLKISPEPRILMKFVIDVEHSLEEHIG
ncbi:WD repeat-containing protein 60 [Papilio xuthus]|uniref:WD repeat-containing protein 60 n=1 Tax=Papilio xuthus TaxID=66420 RepID=A0A194Q2I6_PAPXU|nr:WD repeat-containing protein 60 [Papilio xuthus]